MSFCLLTWENLHGDAIKSFHINLFWVVQQILSDIFPKQNKIVIKIEAFPPKKKLIIYSRICYNRFFLQYSGLSRPILQVSCLFVWSFLSFCDKLFFVLHEAISCFSYNFSPIIDLVPNDEMCIAAGRIDQLLDPMWFQVLFTTNLNWRSIQ